MTGLVSLSKEEETRTIFLLHVKIQEGSHLQTRKKGLTRTEPIGALDLDISVSRIVKNKCMLFKSPSL